MQQFVKLIKKFFWRFGKSLSQLLGAKPKPPANRSRLCISWVIPGKLAVGGSPRPGDSPALARANIKVVFSLCANSEEPLPEDVNRSFRCLRLVLPDSHYKNEIKPTQLAAAVDIIQHSVENKLPIYVHCLAGIERSPTVCIAYLCQHYNLQLWEAVNWLKQVHPYSMPTESQIRAVRKLIQQGQTTTT